ncbi:MAG: cobalamin biosynthesis protein CbiM [Verrucomicrobia bacterium A1]|nr:MAG: cobalamin biosynthesis protein CbiM [Verrucomicrobia bacterium A1]
MHVSEGILTGPVLAAGAVLAAAGVAYGLRRMPVANTPRTAMLAAVFFVASLIHVPFGPSNVHLILNGLAGLLLGWSVLPALAVALLLQAMLFQFGGLTVLGVNTVIMGLPGVLAYFVFGRACRRARSSTGIFAVGAAAGALSVCLSGLLLAVALALGGRAFLGIAGAVLAANIPVVLVDGLVTGFCLVLIRQVRPAALDPRAGEAGS